jgi:hypothetical protein
MDADTAMNGTVLSPPPRPDRLGNAPGQAEASWFFGERPAVYLFVILATVFGACVYSLRGQGIFACQASGYGSDRYLAYCQATRYGDYDYGAFWFDLEPEASDAAANAQVLFLGNSRMQFGLSTEATANWFATRGIRDYLLGFSYNGNYTFEGPLLTRLRPRAKVYVINVDLFFEQEVPPPAQEVMRDPTARARSEQKRAWQGIHQRICATLPAICGREVAYFRSLPTGAWRVTGGHFVSEPVTYDETVDQRVVKAYTTAGMEFLSQLAAERGCILLTNVPTVKTAAGNAEALAAGLGLNLVAPVLSGLNTFDGSHLDRPSAERWSAAFVEAASSQIRHCLDER